jgi:protein involved in polysaccharide export with SLBB domain
LPSAKSFARQSGGILPLPRELDKQVLPPYVVEPGDVLLALAADLDSPVRFPGDQPVLPDGTINLGRYGRVAVAGKTLDEIQDIVRASVQAQLEGKTLGTISVRLMTRVSKVYYVLGEVNAPGAFPLAGRETVLDGILAAGGLTDRASRSHIILSRPSHPDSCRTVLPICYRQIVQLGDTTTNYQLAPGDRIFVASKTHCEELLGGRWDKSSCNGPQVPCLPALGPVECTAKSQATH